MMQHINISKYYSGSDMININIFKICDFYVRNKQQARERMRSTDDYEKMRKVH